MAQIVKLKRTAVSGKVPTTSNLELGELAMNTFDGRIFFEKNSGTPTVNEILTTNTENYITGSLMLNGSITASSGIQVSADIMPTADNSFSLGSSTVRFQLNGGTPVTVDGSGTANRLTRFQSATTVENSTIVSSDTETIFIHSNNGNNIFTVSGSNGELLTVTDTNTGNLLEVNDASGIDVFVVSPVGDVSASGAITASGIMIIDDISVTGNISGSSFNGTGLLSGSITEQLPSGVVSGSSQLTSSYDTRYIISGSLTQTTWDNISGKPAGIISESLEGDNQGQIKLNNQNINVNALGTNDSPTFTNLVLTGNLTVQGTTTTENSQEVNIGDNILNLNYGGSAIEGGILVSDGTGASTTSGSLLWDSTNDYWKAGKLGSEEEILLRNTHGVLSSSQQVVDSLSNQDVDLGTGDLTATIIRATGTGNSLIVDDTLRIAETGSGLRMTNVGAFESASEGFHIFSNGNLRLSTNGSGAGKTAVIFDQTTKDATFEGNILAGNISGSSFNGTGLLSGSITEQLPSGVVSGSSQITDGSGLVSSSDQLSGYISKSADFTTNELLVADGTNSVVSSNILSLDTTNNYLGINQSNPSVTLHMTGEGAQSAQIRMEQHNDSSDAPDIRTRKSRGTAATPTKNNAGDFIYRQNSERYNGSSYVTVGQLAVDTNSTNADRFQLSLAVSEDGNSIDAANAQFVIDGNDNGAITFNDSYKFPTSDGTNGQALVTDGSGNLSFTTVTADVAESSTISDTFTNQSSITVTHNFDTKNVLVSVYGNDDNQIIPETVSLTDTNTVQVELSYATSGFIVVAKGGHLVSGSISYGDIANNPFSQTGNFITASGHIVPSLHETYDLGSTTRRWRDLYLSGSTIDLGGTLITRDGGTGDINFKDSSTEELKTVIVKELQIGTGANARKVKVDGGKIKFADKNDVETVDDLTLPSGVVSGSAQITDLTTHKESVSGASSYAVTHNLNEQYPIVQAWNTSTSQQEVPQSVTSNSANQVTVVFGNTFAGVIIIKK